MSECKWGYKDCKFIDDKCYLCSNEGYYYSPIKKVKSTFKNKNKAKITKRMGAIFEYNNHVNNNEALISSSVMTPNSGAGRIKGDEEIKGLLNIMEELKTCETRNEGRQPGAENFTIKKAWLTKLNKEAKIAEKEFWYLKFAFKNTSNEFFIVIDADVILDMIVTMSRDREIAKLAESKINVAEKRVRLEQAETVKLYAENELLKAEIEKMKLEIKMLKEKCGE